MKCIGLGILLSFFFMVERTVLLVKSLNRSVSHISVRHSLAGLCGFDEKGNVYGVQLLPCLCLHMACARMSAE